MANVQMCECCGEREADSQIPSSRNLEDFPELIDIAGAVYARRCWELDGSVPRAPALADRIRSRRTLSAPSEPGGFAFVD